MPKGIHEIFRHFMEYTTIHGLGRLSEARYWIQRIFWLVVCLACFGACGSQIWQLTVLYRRIPLNTKIQVVHENQFFPTVTFCDLNPLLYSEVKKWPPLFNIVQELSEFWKINLTHFEDPDDVQSEIPHYNYTSSLNLGRYKDPQEYMRRLFAMRMMTLSDKQIRKMASPFEELVIDCKFNGGQCDERNFTLFRDDRHGICFMLNTLDTIAEVAGPSFGLELILNVRQVEYVPFISESAGVRLAITNQRRHPDLDDNGISLPTGFSINVGLSTIERHRYEGTNECDPENTFSSSRECVRLCQAESLALLCGCRHRYTSTDFDDVNRTCDVKDLECLEREIRNFIYQDYCSSQCQVPCRETRYDPVMSMTRWPSGNFKPFVTLLADRNQKDFNKISNDILNVKVYLHSLTKEVITEERAYSDENFLSDIGGQIGLWAGFSVLSLLEIIELFGLFIDSCVRRKRNTEKKDQDDGQQRDTDHELDHI